MVFLQYSTFVLQRLSAKNFVKLYSTEFKSTFSVDNPPGMVLSDSQLDIHKRLTIRLTTDSQWTHNGPTTDSQRTHNELTMDSQLTRNGLTMDVQRTHKGLTQDSHQHTVQQLKKHWGYYSTVQYSTGLSAKKVDFTLVLQYFREQGCFYSTLVL